MSEEQISSKDWISPSIQLSENHELKYIMFRYNLLILHWPLVEGHFWSAIRKSMLESTPVPISRHRPVTRKWISSARKD